MEVFTADWTLLLNSNYLDFIVEQLLSVCSQAIINISPLISFTLESTCFPWYDRDIKVENSFQNFRLSTISNLKMTIKNMNGKCNIGT